MLENLKIAKPCPANWNEMSGDERVRFCRQCSLHVYNLSNMTRHDAETLLSKTEGSVCVRLYKRADGTVITRDCPVGLAALRRRVATLAAGLFATLALGWASFTGSSDSPVVDPVKEVEPHHVMGAMRAPDPAPPPDVRVFQGDVSAPGEDK